MIVEEVKALEMGPDDQQLLSFLSNWSYLNLYLKDPKLLVTRDFLCRLIRLELENKRRKHIVSRLSSMYYTLAKEEDNHQLSILLQEGL